MTIQDYIDTVIQPKIQGDGGWVEFCSLDGEELTLVFRGECSKCLILHRCVEWIEEQIQLDCNRKVTITPVRKRPYFQDV